MIYIFQSFKENAHKFLTIDISIVSVYLNASPIHIVIDQVHKLSGQWSDDQLIIIDPMY